MSVAHWKVDDMRKRFVIALLVTMVGVGGCTPWATYPPTDGAVSFNNPAIEPIPTLMTEAIRHATDEAEATGTIYFNLPEGTPESVWRKVSERLGDAKALSDPQGPAYHITAVRIRTVEAEVDVIRSGPDIVPQLRTVEFKQQIGGWKVVSSREWRIRVEAPEPNYPPEPAEGE
jgi:hypothetical protein